MQVGAEVVIVGRQSDRRVKSERLLTDKYGEVLYVSRFGWASVRLESGYAESYWLNELEAVSGFNENSLADEES